MSQFFASGGQSIGVSASASSPSNEYSGLISFTFVWIDLLAVQGTLNNLLQHHSSKASVLQCSAFLMVQLSHLYMTARKPSKKSDTTELLNNNGLWDVLYVHVYMVWPFLCVSPAPSMTPSVQALFHEPLVTWLINQRISLGPLHCRPFTAAQERGKENLSVNQVSNLFPLKQMKFIFYGSPLKRAGFIPLKLSL